MGGEQDFCTPPTAGPGWVPRCRKAAKLTSTCSCQGQCASVKWELQTERHEENENESREELENLGTFSALQRPKASRRRVFSCMSDSTAPPVPAWLHPRCWAAPVLRMSECKLLPVGTHSIHATPLLAIEKFSVFKKHLGQEIRYVSFSL